MKHLTNMKSRDVIDAEPWNGNIWKMLHGAINPWFDADEVDSTTASNRLSSGVVSAISDAIPHAL